VVAIPITFNAEPGIVVALYDHIDTVLTNFDLWRDPETSLDKFVINFTFEGRFAQFSQIRHPGLILRIR